ncbi:hypothetical protein H311_00221, partial [Anncaliia algerae PRA109]
MKIFLLIFSFATRKAKLEYITNKKYTFYVEVFNYNEKYNVINRIALSKDLDYPEDTLVFLDADKNLEYTFVKNKRVENVVILSNQLLRKKEIIKKLSKLHSSNTTMLPSIFLMNEYDSILLKNIFDENALIRINTGYSLMFLAQMLFYLFLGVLVLSILSIVFVFVTILSEKDPILLPGALEKCLKIKYYKISNKFCTHCV